MNHRLTVFAKYDELLADQASSSHLLAALTGA